MGSCALQLKAIFQPSSSAQLAEVVFGIAREHESRCQSLVEFIWSLQSTSKAEFSYSSCVAMGCVEVQVM